MSSSPRLLETSLRQIRLLLLIPLAAIVLCNISPALAEQKITAEQEKFFEAAIRPILVERCIQCHGPDEQEGGLRLDHHEAFIAGGESGQVIDREVPNRSRLIRSIEYTDSNLQMPPDGKLSQQNIESLRRWVENGAFWPVEEVPTSMKSVELSPEERLTNHKADHWSYQPVIAPPIPPLTSFPTTVPSSYRNTNKPTAIDHFVAKRLADKHLVANAKADKRTLIHRAYFNLTGLPPSYEEVQDFLRDHSPDAFEKVVDRLLESPHYGERWARHWLDIARYGDTTGYIAGSAETRYPYAFTFRDYVIDAFNKDKPFDEFIIEQIAADRLNLGSENEKSLAAMGFLTVGRRFMNRQVDIIDDQIDVISRGFLGLSVACSRCHDHKYDAIPTADYYSLYGVLASSVAPKELPLIGNPSASPDYQDFLTATAAKQKEVDEWLEERRVATEGELQQRIADYLVHMAKSLPQYADGKKIPMQGKRGPLRRAAVQRWQRYLTQPEQSEEPIWHFLRFLGGIPVEDFPNKMASLLNKEPAGESQAKAEVDFLEQLPQALISTIRSTSPKSFPDTAMIVGEYLENILKVSRDQQKNDPANIALADPTDEALRQVLVSGRTPATLDTTQAVSHLDQGERNRYNQLKNAVNGVSITHPGAPPRAMVLHDLPKPIEPVIFKRGVASNRGDRVPRRFLQVLDSVDAGLPFQDGSGRLELARAIANKNNPLTARVIVNRVWQHQFGEGLVRTPSDFGIRGEAPTHPELLDYLAKQFMDQGWSIKTLQKEIMLSHTWQQSSEMRKDAFLADPENQLLWRMPRRRLEFEPLRDRVLAASQNLDKTVGGRSVMIHEESKRRAIYAYIDREDLPGLLANFDLPSPDASRAQRSETTVPQQALYLMNSPFILSQAKSLSQLSAKQIQPRPDTDTIAGRTERIRTIYRNALSRDPSEMELTVSLNFTDANQIQQFRENASRLKEEGSTPRWNFGFGGWDGEKLSYTVFPFFSGDSWQFSEEFPHPKYRYLYLTAQGGHTGATKMLSPIRRWTAPTTGTYRVSGSLNHPSNQGDGVVALLVKNGGEPLERWTAFNGSISTESKDLTLNRGEHLFMIVHLNENTGWDTFKWSPTVDLVKIPSDQPWDGATAWNSESEFSISSAHQKSSEQKNEPDPWIQLAQALLLSNEFAFVD